MMKIQPQSRNMIPHPLFMIGVTIHDRVTGDAGTK
jgi:hypothetical protein